jgi:ADP-ribosyl-[dinitrogen reductase] hydrolase
MNDVLIVQSLKLNQQLSLMEVNVMKRSYDKVKGSLYGFVIGDAMGATNEFKPSGICKLHPITDIVGGGWLNLKPGQVTDDTEMMLCVAYGIMAGSSNHLKLQYICNNFSKWYLNDPIDIGKQCSDIIEHCKGLPYHIWLKAADDSQALGNGSLMRTLPCVLLNQSEDLARLQGQLTHNNSICDNAIRTYYYALTNILAHDRCIKQLYRVGFSELEKPQGNVINTSCNSMYHWSHSHNFEQGMLEAVNNGGDADTIGAITGSLLGAEYGFSKIPERWVNKIDPDVIKKVEEILKYICTNLEIMI